MSPALQADFSRTQMVHQQLRAWDVLEPKILQIFDQLPREQFVPTAYTTMAYADIAIPLRNGVHMLSPKISGRILQAVAPQADERVLEIGTGSGYLTAALAAQGAVVRSLEIDSTLANDATERLVKYNVQHATVEHLDAYAPEALREQYEVIVITGSLPQADERFEQHLVVGGRLFAVIGQGSAMQATLIERLAAPFLWRRTVLFETNIEPLLGANAPESFIF
ncbi:MAG: protein-L-isoaspartate O-methyltransferase [Gammaproteobacteria bacterium]|nr:protein-L-isoaspartate O-methyltransferase [Gammaproteobacteria bacterium]